METFVLGFFVYLGGAAFIHVFCENFVLRIPLLDMHALAIRNFLCIIWLIVVVISACNGSFK